MILRIDKHEEKVTNNDEPTAITLKTFNVSRKEFEKNWRLWRNKKTIGKYKLLENLFEMIFGGIMIIFFVSYVLYILMRVLGLPDMLPFNSFADTIFLGVVFFFAFMHLFLVGKETYSNLRLGLLALIISMMVLGYVKISNTDKAREILKGVSQSSIEFRYNGNTVSTSDSIMLIGRTEKYLFLRDLDKSSNLIFNVEDMQELKVLTKQSSDEN